MSTGAEIVDAIVVSACGPLAQYRCFQGLTPGWRAVRTAREEVAYHECGHVVARWALGLPLHQHVCIERTEFPDAGVAILGYASTAGRLSPVEVAELPAHCDSLQIIRYIRWLSDDRQDRLDTFRRLRSLSEKLIEAHWSTVVHVAIALLRHGELDGEQIAALLPPRQLA